MTFKQFWLKKDGPLITAVVLIVSFIPLPGTVAPENPYLYSTIAAIVSVSILNLLIYVIYRMKKNA